MWSLLCSLASFFRGDLVRYVVVTLLSRQLLLWRFGEVCGRYFALSPASSVEIWWGMWSLLCSLASFFCGDLVRYVVVTLLSRQLLPWRFGGVCGRYFALSPASSVEIWWGMWSLLCSLASFFRGDLVRYVVVTLLSRQLLPWRFGEVCGRYFALSPASSVEIW